jgi:hypothetical protein
VPVGKKRPDALPNILANLVSSSMMVGSCGRNGGEIGGEGGEGGISKVQNAVVKVGNDEERH